MRAWLSFFWCYKKCFFRPIKMRHYIFFRLETAYGGSHYVRDKNGKVKEKGKWRVLWNGIRYARADLPRYVHWRYEYGRAIKERSKHSRLR